jgi:conjugative transposon TraN protein
MKKNLTKTKMKSNTKIANMKYLSITKILSLTMMLFCFLQSNAQTLNPKIDVENLPIIFMGDGVNIHIISPEPIQFVDLSSNELVGDLPAENIARVKVQEHKEDEESEGKNATQPKYTSGQDIGIITVVGQSFLSQYRAIYQGEDFKKTWLAANIHVKAEDMQPLEYPKFKYSNYELKKFAQQIFDKKLKKPIRKKKDLKLTMQLNNVYVLDDYIFLDISIENNTNLACDIEGMKFSIEDKKIYKATNNQSILLNPLFSLNDQRKVRKSYRNIFVFEKFTFPNSKILKIRLLEEQISGRVIDMKINYSDVLEADTF